VKEIDNLRAEVLALIENPETRKRVAAIFDRHDPPNKRAQDRELQISRAVAWLDAMAPAECARWLVERFPIGRSTAYSRIRDAYDRRAKLCNHFRPSCTNAE
jgi:hypothetical protein